VLDAMGVIYRVGNDNRDLLCPFVQEKGGIGDVSRILALYHEASLGQISSAELWQGVGLGPGIEDEYLHRYELNDGVMDFLEAVGSQGHEVWCLSNDISEWSKKLRTSLGLDKYICGFVISGNVHARKPDQAIFDRLLERMTVDPHDATFVDDQLINLDTAAALGFRTILFLPGGRYSADERHIVATGFADILRWLETDSSSTTLSCRIDSDD
jgi:HAD superfamily hydrolase (TIGR01509 family)